MRGNGSLWSPTTPFDPARFPVFYGWVILAASAVGFLASIPGQTVGVSVYTDTYIEVLGLDRIQLTTAYLIGTGLSGFLVSRAGILFDRLGTRRFMVLSAVLFGSSLLFMSQLDRVISLSGLSHLTPVVMSLTAFAFLGLRLFGQGMITLGARSVMAKWWNQKRGQMAAISGIFVSFGFSISPRVLDWEIQALGWRESLLFNAILLTVGFSLFAWFLFRDHPEECGLQMDNGWVPTKRPVNPDTFLKKEFTPREALRTYSFWIITLSLAFQGFYSTAYTFHVIDLARSFHMPREHMLNFFIYGSILAIQINFLVGYITDRIRLKYIICFFGLSGALMTIGLLLLPTLTGQILLICGMGCTWGSFPALSNVGYARYFGRAYIGSINGIAMAWMVWGSAIGPLVFSFSKDYLGGYKTAVLLSTGVYLLLAIGGIFARNPSGKPKA